MKVMVDSLKSSAALEWAVHAVTIAPTSPSSKNWKINKGVDPGIWPISSLHQLGSRLDGPNGEGFGYLQCKATEGGKYVSWVHDYLRDASINHKHWPGFDASKPSSHCFSIGDNEAEALAKCYVKFLAGPIVEIPDGLEIHLPKMLNEACIDGDLQKIRDLLNNGAPINERYAGLTPLHVTIKYGHLEALKLLLDSGADPRFGDRYDSAHEEEDFSALNYLIDVEAGFVCANKKYEAVKCLLRNGADIKDSFGDDAILCRLLEEGLVQVNNESIEYIVNNDRFESAKFLVSKNIHVHKDIYKDSTPRIKNLFDSLSAEKDILSSFDDFQPVFAAPTRPKNGLSL